MAKKKHKLRIPKRIGGVKIPKSVRKGDIGAFLNSNTGQAMMGQAVLLATAAIAGRETHEESGVRQTLKHPGRKLAAAGDALSDPSDRMKYAFGEALRAFREAIAAGGGDQEPWPEPRAIEPSEGGSKKKRPSRPEADVRH